MPRPAAVSIDKEEEEEEELREGRQKACGYVGRTILTILTAVSSSRAPTVSLLSFC